MWRPMSERSAERIVVTGFPGYLAWRVCVALLRARPGVRLDALVSPEQTGAAERAAMEIGRVAPEVAARFRWFPCALAAPGGPRHPLLDGAIGEVTGIVHLAGVGHPCERPGESGVAGVLALAARCPALRGLTYRSTAFISGDRSGLCAEDDFDRGQGFKSPWEAHAFDAERLMRAASADLPIVIVRPTFVVGDSRSGEIDRFDGPYAVLQLIDRLGAAHLPVPLIGSGAALAQIVPVDYVAAAFAHLATNPAAIGGTFHLADPDAPTVWAAYRRCAALLTGYEPFWRIAPGLATRALRWHPLRRIAVSAQIVPYLTQRVSYGTARAHALLGPVGIVPPPFASYAQAIVDFYGDHCDDPRFTPPFTPPVTP